MQGWIQHGRRWRLRHAFRWGCRCGMDCWPCPVERMLRQQAEAVVEARAWRDEQRRIGGWS